MTRLSASIFIKKTEYGCLVSAHLVQDGSQSKWINGLP